MFANFIQAGVDKPLLKCTELDIGRLYRVLGVSKLSSGHKSILIETKDFKFFLPAAYKGVEIVGLEPTDNYSFAIDKVIKLSNGSCTSIVSFYKDGNKIC